MTYRILAVNPGATSTKIAVFEDEKQVFQDRIVYAVGELDRFPALLAQLPYRREWMRAALAAAGVALNSFSAVVGRGGLLAPMQGGTYRVGAAMLEYLKRAPRGEHAANLGAFLAADAAGEAGCEAYIVDPVSTDEMDAVARVSGSPELERSSLFHALNHKAVARRVAQAIGKSYQDVHFIVVHLGTGVTVGAHSKGRVVDVNDAVNEGAFSADRAGSLPSRALMELCFSGKYGRDELGKKMMGEWGLAGYLDTRNLNEIELRVRNGDERAALILDAFVYQITKDIGAMAAVLRGKAERIILTGGMAHSEVLTGRIRERVEFLAPVEVVPGEAELEALAMGGLRVLRHEERAQEYTACDGKNN